MRSEESYVLRLKLVWKLFALALSTVPVWIVWDGLSEGGSFGVLEWFFAATFPLIVVGGVFFPLTLRTRVSEGGISADWYVGLGRLKLYERVDELHWHEVFLVHEGFETLFSSLSPTVVFFGGLHGEKERRIFISSMQKGHEEALTYALRKVRPKVVNVEVRKLAEEMAPSRPGHRSG